LKQVSLLRLMRNKLVLGLIAILLSASLFWLAFSTDPQETGSFPDGFFLGIADGGNVTQTKRLIDETKDFTNLMIFLNLEVTKNKTSLEEIADYAFQAGLSFSVGMTYPVRRSNFTYNPFSWAVDAKEKYGERFLGYYLYDEPGGHQLDRGSFRQFDNDTMPADYRDAANTFTYYLYVQMRDFIRIDKLFTSDYGLYWYDYEAGYDVVLCQFGWNNSRPINIALCRGAAEMHNKTWGMMVTWTTRHAPYIESPSELYQDMVMAYQAGAKYITVFNYPYNVTEYGLLTEEHLDAFKEFKQFVSENPQNKTSNSERVAYVLPDNYGSGFRSPSDTIWGVWDADNKSQLIWDEIDGFVKAYNYDFDIIYGSSWTRFFGRQHYDRLVWWNATR